MFWNNNNGKKCIKQNGYLKHVPFLFFFYFFFSKIINLVIFHYSEEQHLLQNKVNKFPQYERSTMCNLWL